MDRITDLIKEYIKFGITEYTRLEGDIPALQVLAEWAMFAYAKRDVILMHIHLIAAALFPIYVGSHASLSRPPSAAAPAKSKTGDEDDDEIVVEPVMEGLRPSDAILFPIVASGALAGLYYLIQWLNDPALLNKILGYYFSTLGVVGVGRLVSDGLNVATTIVFPSVWSSRGTTYYVDPLLSQQVTKEAKPAKVQFHRKFTEKTNPFPGLLSLVPLPSIITRQFWTARALLKNHWIFRGYVHGVCNVKTKLQLNDVTGFIIGIVAIVLYNTNGKAWWLTNVIGFGLCYGALQLISPTSFWIGSMVMAGLFIYDIVMVFYTPLMVTVATAIDGPIKLVFPGPARVSMLGLGDVVLPGIVIALALRFDLYLHYLYKQKKSADSTSLRKAAYVEATGKWGERFWTRRAKTLEEETTADGSRFSKVYFTASIVGYIVGMLATLAVLHIYNHGQPALLYLVPCVLTSLWGTAIVRGEFLLMWEYTEDGSMDDNEGKEREKGGSESSNDSGITITPAMIEKERVAVKTAGNNGGTGRDIKQHAQHVFLFSLSTPKKRANAKQAKSLRH
jgi:minor histocompatibility antigen H13